MLLIELSEVADQAILDKTAKLYRQTFLQDYA